MKVGLALNRAPFVGTVEARVCKCDMPVKELVTARTADKAIGAMTGYWSMYLTFYGDQIYWLCFTITDIRDGTVIWRDGRVMKEETGNGQRAAIRDGGTERGASAAERWILFGEHSHGSGADASQGSDG